MYDEAAPLPAVWQGRVRVHVFYHGPFGHNTACVLVQWELMSALTVLVLVLSHRLSCMQRRQRYQQRGKGERGPMSSIMGHLGTTQCVLVQWELMSALTLMAATLSRQDGYATAV
jgi:hypothetical protein